MMLSVIRLLKQVISTPDLVVLLLKYHLLPFAFYATGSLLGQLFPVN
jgi:hypothetical protein